MKIHHKTGEILRPGLHVARHPGRMISRPIQKRLEKHGWRHRVFDIFSLLVVLLIIAFSAWYFVIDVDPGRKVEFSAVVAPDIIVSGGESTLAISYTNNSKKTLEGVTLTLEYPPYFVLSDVDHQNFTASTNTIAIDNLAPGANGLVKIRGVMFGDVNGTQTFASTLGYTWNDGKTNSRRQVFTFSPSKSALAITTELPNKLVAGQRIHGSITLKNNGTLPFPEESIHAIFPDGFTLKETSIKQREDKTWIVPSIDANEELTILFAGDLAIDTGSSAVFVFEPSFIFDDQKFVQETLSETVHTVPAPLKLDLDVPDKVMSGKSVDVSVTWSGQNDLGMSDVKIGIEGGTNEPFWNVDSPIGADSRSATIIPLINKAQNSTVSFVPYAEFTLSETGDRVRIVGKSVERKVTTSAVVESFARYFTTSGDQLGRGPLPPRVGSDTIYWIFLNVKGTVNDLDNAVLTAELPANVNWVDKQSVTKGSSVTFNPDTRRIEWSIGNMPAVITSGKIAAASMAVSINPTDAQRDTIPLLLKNISLTGTDAFTNEGVQSSAKAISTVVPQDAGVVR